MFIPPIKTFHFYGPIAAAANIVMCNSVGDGQVGSWTEIRHQKDLAVAVQETVAAARAVQKRFPTVSSFAQNLQFIIGNFVNRMSLADFR